MTATRCGYVALVGRPNVGKSSLLNRIIGERLAIVSAKAQSTRARVVGIRTTDDSQIVFLDTPGLLDPSDDLHRSMRSAAHRALRDADVIVHLTEAGRTREDLWAAAALPAPRTGVPVLDVRTKVDRLTAAERAALAAAAPDASLVSAVDGTGVDPLVSRIATLVPEGPFLHPADDVSTQHLRFFAAELVREAALEALDEEVPHALACVIEEFRESRTPVYIRAVLYVERESQKRIVIGAGGATIRRIGQEARRRIEPLVGGAVYLDLWVKVLRNWRRDPAALDRLGYSMTEDR